MHYNPYQQKGQGRLLYSVIIVVNQNIDLGKAFKDKIKGQNNGLLRSRPGSRLSKSPALTTVMVQDGRKDSPVFLSAVDPRVSPNILPKP